MELVAKGMEGVSQTVNFVGKTANKKAGGEGTPVTECFTAFKKKDEYGPGFIKILDESVDNNELKSECQKSYLLELKSEIKNNDELFEINSYKVYDQLYGNQFGKKTIK